MSTFSPCLSAPIFFRCSGITASGGLSNLPRVTCKRPGENTQRELCVQFFKVLVLGGLLVFLCSLHFVMGDPAGKPCFLALSPLSCRSRSQYHKGCSGWRLTGPRRNRKMKNPEAALDRRAETVAAKQRHSAEAALCAPSTSALCFPGRVTPPEDTRDTSICLV
ncbi:hypothetical protein NDU88_005832 [Pleurodeles waltl]|uniref:Transmembrane protein n=1 Tax=Pleurodeles waltl TaxID=8319 RepID=A0AAV7QME8_PLEWA|nr:hypothetical protein NDU88_005832 [Pleurodeles waltl]